MLKCYINIQPSYFYDTYYCISTHCNIYFIAPIWLKDLLMQQGYIYLKKNRFAHETTINNLQAEIVISIGPLFFIT